MKNFTILVLFLGLFGFLQSCHDHDDHDHNDVGTSEYSIDIKSPNSFGKKVGDTLTFEIDFKEANSLTVHHINVLIYNAVDSLIVYSKPDEAHIHVSGGVFTYSDKFVLTTEFKDTDWILQAKVWGHEDGIAEIVEKVEFHVNP